MKKTLYSLLFVVLMLFGAANCCMAEDSYIIYKNQNFDDHRLGETPNTFDWGQYSSNTELENKYIAASRYNSKIVKIEKDGNSENLAAQLGSYIDPDGSYTAFVRSCFNYYPIKEHGVISFSFRVEDFSSDKRSWINRNVTVNRQVTFMDNKNYSEFITVKSNDVYWNGKTLIKSDIQEDTWYRVDFVFNVKTLNATLYFDGTPTAVTLPTGTVNVSELRFDLPTTEDSAWCIDDIRIYDAGKLLPDENVDENWNRYKNSDFYCGYEFETDNASDYTYMAFLKCDGKRFSIIGTDRLYNDNKIEIMPAKVYRHEGNIMVPVRAVAESYGAEVVWENATGSVVVNYNGKVMKVTPGEDIYYINSKPAKLYYPVALTDGTACMQIDVLFNFLGKEYSIQDDILWLDKPRDFDWHMPLDENGEELWGTTNTYLPENIYQRILRRFLFDVPTDEEVDTAIRTNNPGNQHPRIELKPDSISKIKAGMEKDEQLKTAVEYVINSAKKYTTAALVAHSTSDGKRADYTDPIKSYFCAMAFAYQMSDAEADKADFKKGIWRQIEALNEFPDFHFYTNSALNTGTLCYGLAYAYDWVEWTDEEKQIIEDMARRNVLDYAMYAYKSALRGASWTIGYGNGNQPLITNGGIAMLSIALYESDPEYYSDIIRGAIRATEGGVVAYFPNGDYPEGISYWRYSGDFLPRVLKGLQTSMGSDYGRTSTPGVLETAKFPIAMSGATTGYAFGDGQAEDAVLPLFMFCADQTNNKSLAEYRKQQMGKTGSTVDIINWVYDTAEYNEGLNVYDKDVFAEGNSTVVMRTGYGGGDTTVALHGGANNDPHGHFDSGSVQFDMSGVRFGMDLPREDYNLRDLGYYDKNKVSEYFPNGKLFTGGHFYRTKGEGHNLVVANRSETNAKLPSDPGSYDVNTAGKTEFLKMEFGDTSSFAILDMTDTNDVFNCAIRGVKLDKINNVIEIQDDMRAQKVTDFLWSMHTYANIEISEDGKTAILTQNNQKIKAMILNDCDYRFEELPAAYDGEYGTSNKPTIETPNYVYGTDDPFYIEHGVACDVKMDARKLAVKGFTDHFKLSVAFLPYVEGNTYLPEYVPYEIWKNTEVERQTLKSVTVDGVELETFREDNYNYLINVLTEKSTPPVIDAVAQNSNVEVVILQAQTVPGVTNVMLMDKGETVGLYSFIISPLNNTTKFHSDKQLPIYNYYVTSEPQGENPARNLFDGDFGTKFATDEQGGAVTLDLGSVIEGNLFLNISCLNGDARTENFKIEYSEDGVTYTEAFNGSNSGTTKGLESFEICNKARYVRVSFYGSSQGSWVSVTEMFVSNE